MYALLVLNIYSTYEATELTDLIVISIPDGIAININNPHKKSK
jgi:hypothetical protein